ncbi:MAG TPA: phytoene/squalene synthase family protein [Stellaceae bacterium]|nr:phytoene/squalene synthase family protein [Stellaceae bacterium]
MKGETRESAPSVPPRGLSPLGALLRRHDRDRYQTALFAPAERREALFALYAFNYEIARVRESVTETMLGQIRLQWWREVVEAAYAGDASRPHEVAAPLSAAIREFGLSRAPFERLIDARERDLDDAPPATMAALEDYAEATSASLICLALEILGVRDAAATEDAHPAGDTTETAAVHIGIAYALTGLLRAMPFHARAGRSYIPAELAARTGLDPRDYAAGRGSDALRAAAAEIATEAAGHLAAARRHRAEVPRAALPALLPAIVAERALTRLRRADWNPFDPRVAAPDAGLSWHLLLAHLSRRF